VFNQASNRGAALSVWDCINTYPPGEDRDACIEAIAKMEELLEEE
jgi:hypothetical protein